MTPAPLMSSQLQQSPLQAPQTLAPDLEERPGTAEGKNPSDDHRQEIPKRTIFTASARTNCRGGDLILIYFLFLFKLRRGG